MILTKNRLLAIIKRPKLTDRVYGYLNNCLVYYNIDSRLRICHFLAQVLHESGCFYYMEEIASGEAYEGRLDLGNTEPGDGIKYKGRGAIQITGRSNYAAISKDFAIDFINNPEMLSSYKYGILSAGWYWNKKNLNALADNDQIEAITKKVNGGLNGLESRQKWFDKCKLYINAV